MSPKIASLVNAIQIMVLNKLYGRLARYLNDRGALFAPWLLASVAERRVAEQRTMPPTPCMKMRSSLRPSASSSSTATSRCSMSVRHVAVACWPPVWP